MHGRPFERRPLVRIFYGWIIVGVSFCAWAISTGPRQSFAVFLLAFLEDFGWSRGVISGAFSAHMVFYALGGLGVGVMADRWGSRRVMAWGTAAWAVTLLLCSRIQSAWQLYTVYGVLGGLATSGLAYVPNNALLSRWFIRYRGLAAGLSQSGVPLGTAVFVPLAQVAIATIGWRNTYVGFAALVGGLAFPLILLFLRDDPRAMGLRPDGVAAAAPRTARPVPPGPGQDPGLGAALPPGYWIIFGANVLRGMTVNGVLVHQVAYLTDIGYSKMAAASYFSLSALLAVVGGFTAGGLSDRLGRPRTYLATTSFFVIGIASLLGASGAWRGLLVAIFVVASGLATGGVGPVFAALLTDRFHGPRFGFLMGLQNIAYGGGATLGPWVAGVLFDLTGNYAAAFSLFTLSIMTSALIVMLLGRRAARFLG
jgi:MFS family permease